MTHISNVVEEIIHDLQVRAAHDKALPEMTIAYLESMIEDKLKPEEQTLKNIFNSTMNFNKNDRDAILKLLKKFK